MNVLVVAAAKNKLLGDLTSRLSRAGLICETIELSQGQPRGRLMSWLNTIRDVIRGSALSLNKRKDIVSFHFFSAPAALIAIIISVFGVPFSIHFWGSDYKYWRMKKSGVLHWLFMYLVRQAQFITFSNASVMADFEVKYKGARRTVLVRFGLDVLGSIDNLIEGGHGPAEPVRVVVGTNASPLQQHLEIIDEIENINSRLLSKMFFIFPLSYGSEEQAFKVVKRLEQTQLNYKISSSFISGGELAKFRAETDILIQLQKSDAMSAAMLESLYAGAKVITGTWLPYDELRAKGVDWFEIDKISDLGAELERVLDARVSSNINKKIVNDICGWDAVMPRWTDLYYVFVNTT